MEDSCFQIFIYFYFTHVAVLAYMYLCALCMTGVCGGRMRVSVPFELGLQTAVNGHEGAGIRTPGPPVLFSEDLSP